VPLERLAESVVQVRSGIVPDGFKEAPKLVCAISYVYLWDLWFRFQHFDLVLYDFDTEEVVLRAGQYGDNPLRTENQTLADVFEEIKTKLHAPRAPEARARNPVTH
jgi:hypothetical protein